MADTKLYDSILHIKSEGPGEDGNVEKVTFPVTRWENVLGAPRVVYPDAMDAAAGAAYVLLCTKNISISDDAYKNCYGDL